MSERGVAAGRVVQRARALRRRHGAGHRVRRHRPQGGHRAPRAHDQRPRQLCEAGRPNRLRHDPRPADRGHLSQGQHFFVPQIK